MINERHDTYSKAVKPHITTKISEETGQETSAGGPKRCEVKAFRMHPCSSYLFIPFLHNKAKWSITPS